MNDVIPHRARWILSSRTIFPGRGTKQRYHQRVRLICFERILQLEKKTKSAPWNWATDNKSVNMGQWSEYWVHWKKKIHHISEKYIFRHLVSTYLVPLRVTLAADLLCLLITKREKKRRKFVLSPSWAPWSQYRRPGKTARVPCVQPHASQLHANFMVPSSPWDEEQSEAEKTLPVWRGR